MKARRFWILSALLLTASVALLSGSLERASAASPGSGTIGPSNTSLSWTGQFYAAAATVVPEACPPQADPANALCDHFFLTVSAVGEVTVTINWPSDANDFDLYVYDNQTGAQVDFSAAGGTTSEQVVFPNPIAGRTYEVRVNPFLVINSGYTGSASYAPTTPPAPNPLRPTGGIRFAPATVIDTQRTEGEPLNWIDPRNGSYWETGPWGFSTAQMFVHRSVDGGDQFNIVSPAGLRPNPSPGGGGDSDILTDDRGFAYFVDLEGLLDIGCGISNDNGNNWRENNACATRPVGDDRQWIAVDNGLTSATSDNTIFHAYRGTGLIGSFIDSTPGSTGPTDPVGGLVYLNSSTAVTPVSNGAPCGQLRFDPVKRNLYYPCSKGDHVEITVGHVNPGQRTGITYTNVQAPPSPGGAVGDIFPAVAVDRAGNIYAVWVDETNHNVYYAASRNAGATWGAVRQINGRPSNSNVFPWAQAGANGTLAVAWLGTDAFADSDTMPSWYNDRQAATAHKWFGYVALIRSATGSSPTIYQQRFTDRPMHYGQICNMGLGCTVSGGDRTMADFMALHLDRDGSMRLVYNDTTSQHHGAHLFEARQIGGVAAFNNSISKPSPDNPMSDPRGDAQHPHYAPTGAGANLPQFDLIRLRVSQPNATTLRFQMTFNRDVEFLLNRMPPVGQTRSFWATRFQALSTGDGGEESYRIFYVGAEFPGNPLTQGMDFFAGSGESAQGLVPGNGCVTTTEENCKIVQYPNEVPATGFVAGNTIVINVPIQGGFGADRPIKGDMLYSVTAFTAGRTPANPIYADLDATRAFNYQLGFDRDGDGDGDGDGDDDDGDGDRDDEFCDDDDDDNGHDDDERDNCDDD